MRALLLLPALFLAACGSDTAGSAGAPPQTIAVRVEPCKALTPSIVAAALDVPEASVALNEEGMGMLGRDDCLYKISDSATFDNAYLQVEGYESANAAEAAFSARYRARTDQEVAQIEEAGDRAVEQLEAGERAEADDLEGTDVGGSLARMAASARFEDVAGIGDQATIEDQPAIVIPNILNLPSVPGTIYVREGAVIFTLIAAPNDALHRIDGAYDAIRDAYLALAQAVVAGL